VADGFSERYGDLLFGSYDCVDRIALNAYLTFRYSPGGFRNWWRRLHGDDEQLDNAHLMRMAGRFARRVRGLARAHDIPVIECKRGERKHQIAEQHLKTHDGHPGVFHPGGLGGRAGVGRNPLGAYRVLGNLAKPKLLDLGLGESLAELGVRWVWLWLF
jgi:hypothetical protein